MALDREKLIDFFDYKGAGSLCQGRFSTQRLLEMIKSGLKGVEGEIARGRERRGGTAGTPQTEAGQAGKIKAKVATNSMRTEPS